jgi:hypothetical protein
MINDHFSQLSELLQIFHHRWYFLWSFFVGVYNLKFFDLSLTLGRFPSLNGSFSSVYHNTYRLNAIGQKKASTYFLAITVEIHIIWKEGADQVRHILEQ